MLKKIALCSLLFVAFSFADSESKFRVNPSFYKEGEVVKQPFYDFFAFPKKVTLSELPLLKFNEGVFYWRHKQAGKSYFWTKGELDYSKINKLHAFSIRENQLKVLDVVGMRFYPKMNAKAYQDESDLFFDDEYIYSARVPKLFFFKDNKWEVLHASPLPGKLSFDMSDSASATLLNPLVTLSAKDSILKKPDFYATVFSQKGSFSYATIINVAPGIAQKIKPEFIPVPVDTTKPVILTVTEAQIDSASQRLEDLERLFDIFAAEVSENDTKLNLAQIDTIYPAMQPAESLGVAPESEVYKAYQENYIRCKREAAHLLRATKMQNIDALSAKFKQKFDSLHAMYIVGKLNPNWIYPVMKDNKMVSVQLQFGKPYNRYHVFWEGTADSLITDTLYQKMIDKKVEYHLHLENNKPVWFFLEDSLRGRFHYRFVRLDLMVEGKRYTTQGMFSLPDYLLTHPEVIEWQKPKEKPIIAVQDTAPKEDVKPQSPIFKNLIPHHILGELAVVDSGSFRFLGKVVSMSSFAIMTTELTQEQLETAMALIKEKDRFEDKSEFKDPKKPVHNITWYQAEQVCKALEGDLPTEAQWEYAARAGDLRGRPWIINPNESIDDYAIYKNNSYKKGKNSPEYGPQIVKSKKANAWGIYDMSGNVAEWTRDKHSSITRVIGKKDPTRDIVGATYVYKGGSWKDKEKSLNLTEKDDEDPRYWSNYIGFRCVFPREF